MQQILPTFPYFQMNQFSNIIADLGLSPASYLDTFNSSTHQWEQHTISTVRIVEGQQRLLYKTRRTLIEGLAEEECLSLHEEIQLQLQTRNRRESGSGANIRSPPPPPPTNIKTPIISPSPKLPSNSNEIQIKSSLKRAAPQEEQQDPRDSPKLHVSNGYYMAHSATSTMVSSPVTGPSPSTASSSTVTNNQQQQQQQQQSSAQGPDNNVYMYQNPVYYSNSSSSAQGSPETVNSLPHYLLSPHATTPIPYHPHPPLKRWPNDYTVSELSQGFHAMDLLISQSPTGASMTQRTAFERVFGSRYVKSTVCRHRAVWRKAPRLLREQFEHMGIDDRACWGEFVRRVENRPPGKHHHSNLDVDVDVEGMLEAVNVGVGVGVDGQTHSGNMGYHSHSHSHDQHQQDESEQEDVEHVHGQEVLGPLNQGTHNTKCPNSDIK